jgi:hypothetical protein
MGCDKEYHFPPEVPLSVTEFSCLISVFYVYGWKLLKASGLKIVEKSPLCWDRFHLASRPEKLRARLNSELNNVRIRQKYRHPEVAKTL